MRVKMSKQPPPAPTASAVGPCPTVIKIVGRPGTGSLPSTIAPPDHPQFFSKGLKNVETAVVNEPSVFEPKKEKTDTLSGIIYRYLKSPLGIKL